MRAEDWEEEEVVRALQKRKSVRERNVPTRRGQVIGIGPRGCEVMCGQEVLPCKPKTGLAVGDLVEMDRAGNIREILPRRTILSRPDPGNPKVERVIAANVDIVVMVVSVRSPALRPGLIDRYLIAIEKGGAQPVLCLNKVDLVESPEELQPLEPYRELGLRLFPVSTRSGEGLSALRQELTGKLAVLVGHSGVGKSSLMNALKPGAGAVIGKISAAYQKGRHTTTGSTMYRTRDGINLIDTPGVREFGLWKLDAAELNFSFHEFDGHRGGCQFGDCTHTHEPVCGVKEAVENGALSRARYGAYLRIRETLE